MGLEFPARLFDLLMGYLSIERGCILFPDASNALLLPWASSGLDETSTRRIRIPAKILGDATRGSPALVSGASFAAYKLFFSHRDFRGSGALRAIPVALGSLDTVYVISLERRDAPSPRLAPEGWERVRDVLGARLSSFRGRFRPAGLNAESSASGIERERALKSEISGAAAEARAKGLSSAFAIVPLDDAIDAACAMIPGADRFRIFSETIAAMSRVVPSPGLVVPLPRSRAGVLICGSGKPDPDLFLVQLGSSLARMLTGSSGGKLAAEACVDPLAAPDSLDRFLRLERHGEAAAKG